MLRETDDQDPYNLTFRGSDDQSPKKSHSIACNIMYFFGKSSTLFPYYQIVRHVNLVCDAPKPGGPLTTRQPAENLYISYHEMHT